MRAGLPAPSVLRLKVFACTLRVQACLYAQGAGLPARSGRLDTQKLLPCSSVQVNPHANSHNI